MAQLQLDELMTDDDFVKAVEQMSMTGDTDIGDLLKAMNENRIISWEEAERILQDTSNQPVKSSLPEQTRPTEPDNDTDVDRCIQRLLDNDPTLKEVNLNNMKRTPVPQIRRLIEALAYNEYCERISFANMGLYDNDVAVLITVVEMNQALKKLNLETNYLSGDFFSKLFNAALANMTLEEIKAVNQGTTFSTVSEKEIIDAVVANNGLIKVSVNLRLPEGRHKIEHATLRNGEYRRMLRREAALKAKKEEEEKRKEEEASKTTAPKPAKEPVKPPAKAPPSKPRALPASLTNPTIASSSKEKEKITSPTKPPSPVKKWVRKPVEEEPEPPKHLKMKAFHPLARRQCNTDSSSTPVLQIAGGPTSPIKKLSEGLRKTSQGEALRKSLAMENGDVSTKAKPPVKKLSGVTTASVTEKATSEANEAPAENASPTEEKPDRPSVLPKVAAKPAVPPKKQAEAPVAPPPKLTWAERRAAAQAAAAKAAAAKAETEATSSAQTPVKPVVPPKKAVVTTPTVAPKTPVSTAASPMKPTTASPLVSPKSVAKTDSTDSTVPKTPLPTPTSEALNGEEVPKKKKKIIKKKVIRKKKKPEDAPPAEPLAQA